MVSESVKLVRRWSLSFDAGVEGGLDSAKL